MGKKQERDFMNQLEKNFENVDLKSDLGFDIRFVTMQHNSPHHWHREMEVLYILNGHATINMDGEKYELGPLEAIVMDYSKVHEVLYALPQTMGICIHVSRKVFNRLLPNQELLMFRCVKEHLTKETVAPYERICEILKDITILYVNQKDTYQLRSTAYILNLMAELVEHFSEPVAQATTFTRMTNIERLEQVCDYVEHHYTEEIALQDAADELGLNREYFCRFFKQNMGISFVKYVNQVRINHIYQDLLYTEDSIQEIIERHGFFNQKLFYQMFKSQYGCSPREARNMAQNNPYV